MRLLVSVMACAMLVGGAASAQNATRLATYGEEELRAGFSPDPHEIRMPAGGNLNSSRETGCSGNINNAPDYELTYQAGSAPLIFRAVSETDTTLVINGPDGQWYCNDDTDGLNPEIRFDDPDSGEYDVWIGTFGDANGTPATLQVTEHGTPSAPRSNAASNASGPSSSMPDPGLTATFGEINLRSGFTPDPRVITLEAGGTLSASTISSECSGSIARAPDYQINYTAGRLPLIIRTHSTRDTTLVISDPEGRWRCNDDSGSFGDAQVVFDKPSSGFYDIWVGVYSGGQSSADLILTEHQ